MDSMTETNRRAGDRRYLIGFSIAGSLITILFFAFINFSTGARFPWFLFPSFAILWWPLVMFFGTGHGKTFSIIGSVVIIASLLITNYVTSPSVIWFYYPAFAVIWWPLSVLLADRRTIKAYSVVGALILAAFFTLENLLKSPFCPWALLTYFPVLMWPVGILLGKRLGKLYIALPGSLVGILYYAILNITVFPGFPWAIFPAYALLWWPLAIVSFAKRKRPLLFSVAGTLLSTSLFIAVNAVSSSETIWAVYPIFAILWWPLSVYYFVYRQQDAGPNGLLFRKGNK
jgi:hypothetical protein